MITTTSLFTMGQLAEASYADVRGVTTRNQLIDALRPDFSQTQATDFADLWSVAHHQANTSSGFSATLFQDRKNTGRYVYALRGTELVVGGGVDFLGADVGDIVTDGLAIKQIVDMYNDVQRMRTAAGQGYQAVADRAGMYRAHQPRDGSGITRGQRSWL